MARTSDTTLKSPSLTDRLQKLSIVPFAAVLYGTGFAITNSYLGSMGVVSLDILRARYIVTGLVFLIYAATVVLSVLGLLWFLRLNKSGTTKWRLAVVPLYSIVAYFLVGAVVIILASLSGSPRQPPSGIPGVTTTPSLSSWFTEIWPFAFSAKTTFLTVIVAALLVFLLDNIKGRVERHLPIAFHRPRETGRMRYFSDVMIETVLPGLLGLFFLIISWQLFNSFSTHLIGHSPLSSNDTNEGWQKFFIGSFGTYALMALYVLLKGPDFGESGDDESENKVIVPPWFSIQAVFALILLVLTLPLYTLGIYPHLPQHLGGGQLIEVEVFLSSKQLKSLSIDSTGTLTYLVDRTSSSSIFLIADSTGSTVVELPNTELVALKYRRFERDSPQEIKKEKSSIRKTCAGKPQNIDKR